MHKIKIASVQMEHQDGDKAANMAVIRQYVTQAAAQGVQVITFPECCITGYWHLRNLTADALMAISETVPAGPSTQQLLSWSKQYNMIIGAGLVERGSDGVLYNTYVVTQPDGRVHTHRKIHTFVSAHMGSGSDYTVFDTVWGIRIGVLICYDNNIIENVRATALAGAQLLLAPHQTGGCRSNDPNIMGIIDRALWDNRHNDPQAIEGELRGDKGRGWLMRWLPSRAHDNGIYLAFSNGVGVDDDEVRTGNAMIIDPYGRILCETWKASNDMVIADMDPDLIPNSTGQRWIRTRRPPLYTSLTQRSGQEVDVKAVRFDDKGA